MDLYTQSTDSAACSTKQWEDQQPLSVDQLIGNNYPELVRRARGLLRNERHNHTLQTSALVHEAYLRLLELSQISWQDRSHFSCVAAGIMRRILVDHARGNNAQKRFGGYQRVTLVDRAVESLDSVDVLALDTALARLAKHDSTQARIVELRFFGGLTTAQVADTLGLSTASVKRKWSLAQAWLYRELSDA